jgi:hypothetical protein
VHTFNVRIYAIRRRRNGRRPFEVRWHAAGRARSRSFTTRGLADSYRAELVRAASHGLEFDTATGEPARRAAREAAGVSWHEHAAAYAAMKWPRVAAHTRAGIADALATITPALTTPGIGRPPPAVLRAALYRQAFNPSRRGAGPCPAAAAALRWAEHHSLPLAELTRPARDPARAAGPHPAAGRHPRRGGHHHPQTGGLPQRPGLRRRTWPPGFQSHRPHPMEGAGSVRSHRPATGRQPRPGARRPG